MYLIPSEPPPHTNPTPGRVTLFSELLRTAADNPGEWFKLSDPVSRKAVTRARKNYGTRYEITSRIEDLPRDGKKVWVWIRARVAVEPPADLREAPILEPA